MLPAKSNTDDRPLRRTLRL